MANLAMGQNDRTEIQLLIVRQLVQARPFFWLKNSRKPRAFEGVPVLRAVWHADCLVRISQAIGPLSPTDHF